jgi:hypothetical protein
MTNNENRIYCSGKRFVGNTIVDCFPVKKPAKATMDGRSLHNPTHAGTLLTFGYSSAIIFTV